MKTFWERGRPARTKPDAASTISPTCIHRERRRGSPSAWALPFPTTGRLPAASQGNSAAAKGTACGRDARAPRGCPNWRSASRRRRWGRPRSQGMPSRRVTSQKAGRRPLGNSRLPAGRAPAPGPRGSLESETTDYGGLSGGRTLWGEAGRRPNILFIPSIHVNQGLTHAGGRDQTPGTSTRDLDVKWCPSWITSVSFVALRGFLFLVLCDLPGCPSWIVPQGFQTRDPIAARNQPRFRNTRAAPPVR